MALLLRVKTLYERAVEFAKTAHGYDALVRSYFKIQQIGFLLVLFVFNLLRSLF